VLIGLALVSLLAMALEAKTSRHDGTLIRVHPYRRIMWFLMPTRNESVVYWDFHVRAEKLLDYLEIAKGTLGAQPTHALVGAVAVALDEHQVMNRFVSGKRLYQRKGRWVSFSMKRKRMDKESKLAVVKREIPPEMTFADLCADINGHIEHQRSGKRTYTDSEISWFNLLPRPVFSLAFRLAQLANHYNLLPGSFIDGDPMHCSLFISNLGSMGMDPGYHHLFEWGNCPIFLMVGQVNDVAIKDGDGVLWTKQMTIRVSYDERVNDGLSAFRGVEAIKRVLEDPFAELGCVAEDGSDRFPLLARA
jgi:hypothetical protein